MGLFDKNRIAKSKKGVLIVNNARGAIMDAQAVADASSSGHIAVAMTPHIYGTTIDAQLCYAAGIKDMLERHFKGEDFPEQHYIVKEGQLASQYR
ncbi:unnamed protein product [Lupinus luteus]|uniref:D-isomer specific 2-hydroxyacid dehydrogenase NAD-binding domain-containing protein n=1 Tax=Lupinus luteus TaxID=3873 RepID=A0AAV1WTF5_LUPLU